MKKSSVKTKLIAIMISVALVPLAVSVLISYFSSTNKAKSDAMRDLQWESRFLESEINTIFLKNQTALTSFAASPTTIAFLKGEDVNPSLLKKQMERINANFDDSNQIVLSDNKGMMVLRSDNSECKSIAERDYYKNAMAGNINVSEIIVSASTNVRSICVAVPVYDNSSDRILGVVHRNFDLNDFHKLLAADAEEAFLVDATGILAAHSDYEIGANDEPTSYASSPYMTSDKTEDVYVSRVTGAPTYVSYTKEPFSGYTICVARSQAEVVSEARRSAVLTIAVGFAMLVLVLLVSLVVSKSFTNPILEVNKLLSALATGEFVQIDKYKDRTDEFGQMINNSNTVVDKLRAIVEHIKESSNTVNNSSEELSDMATQIAATAESVAEAVQEIAEGATEQAKEVQNSAENAGYITEAVEGVKHSASDLNNIAGKMKVASESSSESLTNFHESSEVMASKIVEIADKISATQNAVSDINARVEGISDIAAQTNLLSLNASIEAARAGEAGRGFAVVAEEIRKLADDSESLASEIHDVMESLLSQSTSAVEAAQEIIEDNKLQQAALAKTIEAVDGMLSDIEETVEKVDVISGETDTCVESNRKVSNAMASLSAISEENAAATETTGASVEELSATVTTLAESAENLKQIAKELDEEIRFFK